MNVIKDTNGTCKVCTTTSVDTIVLTLVNESTTLCERCREELSRLLVPDYCTVVGKEYLSVLESTDRFMDALVAAGVDNWEGYSFAKDLLQDQEGNT